MSGTEQLVDTPETRDKNAYIGVCTECGLEDSLPVSNAEELPDVGETVTGFICDCENTTWDVTGYDRVVFQRESRYELGPDISGTEHNYGVIEWKRPDDDEYPRPECPVRQLGSTDKAVGCSRIAERFTDQEGRGAWRCPWHGHFRVIDYPREDDDATEQATLVPDGGHLPSDRRDEERPGPRYPDAFYSDGGETPGPLDTETDRSGGGR